jgi:hypothetical protein
VVETERKRKREADFFIKAGVGREIVLGLRKGER